MARKPSEIELILACISAYRLLTISKVKWKSRRELAGKIRRHFSCPR